jgi:Protein of unknown function (DUF3224)
MAGANAGTDSERTTARGTIEVAVWQPEPYDEPADGPSLVRVHVEETFAGDIKGSGVATFLQVVRGDGSASFCGVERVVGSIAGRAGTFVLQDTGTLTGGNVSGTWFVVEGSGTGRLAGLRGEGGFKAELGQRAEIRLDYWFD